MTWLDSFSSWAQGRFEDFVNPGCQQLNDVIFCSKCFMSVSCHKDEIAPLSLAVSGMLSPVGTNYDECNEDTECITNMETLTCDISEDETIPVMGTAALVRLPRNFHSLEERSPQKIHHPFCVEQQQDFASHSSDKNLLGFFPKKPGLKQKDLGKLSARLKAHVFRRQRVTIS